MFLQWIYGKNLVWFYPVVNCEKIVSFTPVYDVTEDDFKL